MKGTDAVEVAQVLDLLCEASRRKPAEGEEPGKLAERAVAIKERALGPDHPEVATSLMNVAVVRARGGDPAGAKQILERALAIREASLGPDHPLVAASLEALAGLLMGQQDDDGARRLIERVLRIRETAYGADHPETVRTVFNAGIYYAQTNDYVGARAFFERARELGEKGLGRDHLLTFSSLTGLAVVAGSAGQYAEAARLNEQLLLRVEAAFGPTDPRVRFPLDSLAQDLRDLGDYSAARNAAERSLAISERSFGPDHPAVARNLHTLATVLAEVGDYAGAMQLLERATRISEKHQADPTASSLWALKDVFHASGVTEIDAPLFVSLIAFRESRYGPAHPAVGDTLGDLAALLSTVEDYRRTRALFERALAARERALGADHPEIAAIATNLANVLSQAGDDGAARPLYERALSIREKSMGADHPKVAAALANLARLHVRAARYAEARPLLERALVIQQKKLSPDHPDGAATLVSLAELEAGTGATIQAFETAARAEAIGREHMRLTSRTLSERQALAYASSGASALDVMLGVASTRPGDGQTSTAAWNAVIRGRGMVLDEMAARHRVASASEDQEIVALTKALASARQRLAAAVVRGIRDDSPERYRRLLDQARRDRDRAERDLAEKSARFREDLSRSRVGLPELTAALPDDSALVAFVRYRGEDLDHYLAFVLRGGAGVPAVVPLGTAARIDGLIVQWRRQLDQEAIAAGRAAERGEAAYRRVAGELRQQIWDPLLPHLSNAARVFLVPDGALHLVSFGALPTTASRYLVETGRLIHYLSAERDLVPTEEARPAGGGLLALGGPAFDESSQVPVASEASFRGTRSACSDFQSMRFDPLPASLKEVDEVVTLWNRAHGAQTPDTIRLTGAAASESAFKAEAAGRRVLHLATHGFFLGGRCASGLDSPAASMSAGGSAKIARENPLLLSGLILAGANRRNDAGQDQEDGVLTAEEVAALNLSDVEWAVLSGCDTGAGEVRAGEGVFGLRRAFQVAGARTVIMSLWPVEDQTTRQWMTTLYEGRLMKKLGTAEAVREANLAVLRQRRAKRLGLHPFYWAAFVAAGDWR
jgi:CHAT domain-containing protein/Tfp pilus assembly protein PilF